MEELNMTKSVKELLKEVFDENSAGIYFRSKHDNLLPVVKFAKTQTSSNITILTGTETELHHCCSQLDSIVNELNRLTNTTTDSEEKYRYQQEVAYATDLLSQLRDSPEYSRLINIYHLLIKNWEDLKGLSVTYRLLVDLVDLQKEWEDTRETRTELLNILETVKIEWND